MKINDIKVFEGPNIYSHRKCIRLDVDLQGYSEIPSNEIPEFNFNIRGLIPELETHRCGIDEVGGFIKRLEEGTYLAHISEHCILAIQNRFGIEVCYGKAREIEGDLYYVVFEYKYSETAIAIAELVVDTINALINKRVINFDERINWIKEILRTEEIGPSTEGICSAAKKNGLPVIKVSNSHLYQIGYGRKGKLIQASIGNDTSCISVDIASDKMLTKELLKIQNLPIAKGKKVTNIVSLLREAEYIGYPLVLKPQYGNKGKGVVLNIKGEKELVEAYEKIKHQYKDILIEEYITGNDYRVCVIDYKVVAVSQRLEPRVIGDGKSTIRELILRENCNPLRGEDHEKPLTKINIDEEIIRCIGEEGYKLDSVLGHMKVVRLRRNANLSTGGEAIDCTQEISKVNEDICIRAAKALGLDICGIDLCTDDISKSLYENGIIVEINAAPGLRMHLYPSEGSHRDVGDAIINMMYKDDIRNIPVISITGTNGKTTTTRGIAYTLNKMGYTVGMTTTEGIYIGEECIDKGDDTGFNSARCVLMNKDVDVAVLETARGGIIRSGLAYEKADVAIITNIREDHLGIDGINSMEDLSFVKSLVGEEVKEDGFVVINADDFWSKKIIERISTEIIYFSLDYKNELIQKNIINKKKAIYIKDSMVVAYNNGKEYIISKVDDIPITHNGKLTYNTENILAICSALVAMKVDYAMIKKSIQSFGVRIEDNRGRFNKYEINGVNIILDYGHNLDGYRAVLPSVKEMSKGKVMGVVGIPGDRADKMAIEVGEVCAEYLDSIFIKEDKDRRGREKGEICDLILRGVKYVKANSKVKIILDESEALREALLSARENDTIIVFFENENELLSVLEDYKNSFNKIDSFNLKQIGLKGR